MLFMRSFINLFFVPVVAWYLISKKVGKTLQLDFESVVVYVMLVCFNIPVTRVITFVLRITTGKNIEADSSYYTVAALISAAILPYIFVFGKSLFKVEVTQDTKLEDNSSACSEHSKSVYN